MPHAVEAVTLHGVRALGDGTWVAWSEHPETASRVVLFDGVTVTPLPSAPLREIARIDGHHGRFLLAGDRDGRASVWDGAAWSPPARVGDGEVWTVLLRNAHEAWAALFPPGALAAWDGLHWRTVAPTSELFSDIVCFDGALVLAGGRVLRRWDGTSLTSFDPLEDATRPPDESVTMSAHEIAHAPFLLHLGDDALLATAEAVVVEYIGRESGRTLDVTALRDAIGARRPLWETAAIDSDPGVFRRPFARMEIAPLYGTKPWFAVCVGEGFDDAHLLFARSEEVERYAIDEADWVVAKVRDGVIEAVSTTRVVLRDLQRVASGRAYVAAFTNRGGVWRTPVDGRLAWERLEVPAMQGLFALDDGCVMCWGGRGEGQHFYLLDERGAREIPSPSSRVVDVHGCAPDWIVAVGHDGLVTRWDGSGWHPWAPVLGGMLGSVHVVSPDEMYATGPCGALLEGSRYGWVERAPIVGAATQVLAWQGEVYVANPVEGLQRLRVGELVPVDLPVWPSGLCGGREALLMVERDGFVEARGMKSLRRITQRELDVATRDHPALWR